MGLTYKALDTPLARRKFLTNGTIGTVSTCRAGKVSDNVGSELGYPQTWRLQVRRAWP
jgi:hypothetical protein